MEIKTDTQSHTIHKISNKTKTEIYKIFKIKLIMKVKFQ